MKVLMTPSIQGLSGRWDSLVFETFTVPRKPEDWGTTKCLAREYKERIAPIPVLQQNINTVWKVILAEYEKLKLNLSTLETWKAQAIIESGIAGYLINSYQLFTGYFLSVYTAMVGSHVPVTTLTEGNGQAWGNRLSRKFIVGVDMGYILQVKTFQTGAVATGTTIIPLDNTIPQNTEGTEFMSLLITPNSATNRLQIDVTMHISLSIASHTIVAVFQDTATNSLASGTAYNTATNINPINFTYIMTAGTTTPTTIKIRAGGDTASTLTFNGVLGIPYLGGSLASSLTITELAP